MMQREFSQLVLSNFRQPVYAGVLPPAANVYCARVEIPGGDKIQLQLAIQTGIIVDLRYQVYGCPAMIACMSWLAGELIQQPCSVAAQLTAQKISLALALPAHKFHCALLAAKALHNAVHAYQASII